MQHLEKLREAIKIIKKTTYSGIQLQHIELLLALVKANPDPLTYNDLIEQTGCSLSAVSRLVRKLGVEMVKDTKGEYHDVGFGLVQADRNPINTRELVVSLTAKGRKLCDILDAVLK